MNNYTADDVRNILTAFAEEFAVDIPAVHNKEGYWIEFTELSSHLILADDTWLQEIADYANED